jgi:hypothetical protein
VPPALLVKKPGSLHPPEITSVAAVATTSTRSHKRRLAIRSKPGHSRAPDLCSLDSSLIWLAGHRPHRDDVGKDQDERDDHRHLEQSGALAATQPEDADAAEDERQQEE